jgi:hypothetical protein
MRGSEAAYTARVRSELDCVLDPWQLRLTRAVQLKNGSVLETLADVRELILALPPSIQTRDMWQALCEDLLAAADTEYTNGVTRTLEVVLGVCGWGTSDRRPRRDAVPVRRLELPKDI